MDNETLAKEFWKKFGNELLLRLLCEDMQIYKYERILENPYIQTEEGITFKQAEYRKYGKDETIVK